MSDWEGIVSPITAESVRFAPGEHAKYVANNSSFGKFMRSGRMRDVTAKIADEIAKMAASLAPRSTGEGPHMADEFEVEKDAGYLEVGGNSRVLVRVVNNSDHAAVNEFGGKHNKKSRMLGRAGAMFGDYKPEEGRP